MAGREVGAELLGRDAEELLQRADIAMYTVKETHAGFVLFDPTQDQHRPHRLALLGELRRAIERACPLSRKTMIWRILPRVRPTACRRRPQLALTIPPLWVVPARSYQALPTAKNGL
jgi:hypothetical protein